MKHVLLSIAFLAILLVGAVANSHVSMSNHPNPHVRGPNCLGCHPAPPVMKKEVYSNCHQATPVQRLKKSCPTECCAVFYHPYGDNGPRYYMGQQCGY